MKKLLSITLAVALVMSLFCVVPASATMISSTGIYAFEDFEDGTSSITTSKGSLEVVAADNGSANAVKYTFASTTDYPDLSIPSTAGLKTGFTTDMVMKGTVKYKLGKALSSGYLTLLTVNSGDKSYYSQYTISNLTDTTNWYTAEFEIPAFAAATDSLMFQLRIGNASATTTVAADGGDVVIYLDDIEITREKATNKEILEFSNSRISDYNFSWQTGSREIVADPIRSNNNVLKVTSASNSGNYNLVYFQNKASKVTYKVGDVITVSVDMLVTGMGDNAVNQPLRLYPRATDKGTAENAYLSALGNGYQTRNYTVENKGQWQTLSYAFEVTALGNGQYMPYFYISENTNTDTTDDPKKDMGNYTYYFDNVKVEVSDRSAYTVPSATGLSATIAEDGTVTPSYTYAETAVTGVTAGTDASLLKVKTANGAVVASAVAGGTLTVPEAYRSQNLTLEVTPVSTTGTFGDVVTAAIKAPVTIVGTTLTQASGSVTVATETALTNAKLIFVTYDANNKMVDWESVDVTLAAQGTDSYAPVDLTAGSYTKAMLWVDMTNCVPLADMIQY